MSADQVFPKAADIPFENEWKHIALTQTPNGFEDRTVWELFLDGESMGCVTGAIASANLANRAPFYIGSRANDSLGAGCYDCFRACSRVLSPREFLNATNGTAVAAADVLALWPLDVVNGGLYLDGHDVYGNYPFGKLSDFSGRVALSPDQAVASVPNPDPAVWLGDPGKNNGSASFPDTGAEKYLYVGDGVGGVLNLTNDFTVESWFRLKMLTTGWQVLYNAGGDAPRWALWVRSNSNVVKYMMIAQIGNTYYIPDNTFFMKDGTPASITSEDVNVWRHVALVYRADVGNGTFELFVDGVSKGTIELRTALPPGGLGIADRFFVGGRPNLGNSHPIVGNVDLLRISRVALTPDRFLCAAAQGTSAAPPRTLAYWPLDFDGANADLSDRVSANFPLIYAGDAPVGTNIQFRARVGNPDRTAGFIGDPAVNVGSILNAPATILASPGLRGAVTAFSSFTAEGWICWSGEGTLPQAVVGNQLQNAFGWTLSVAGEGELRLAVRDMSGICLVDKAFGTGPDALRDCWRHVAVAYSPALGRRGRWEVFLDGRSLGTAENETVPSATGGVKGRFGIGAQSSYQPFAGLLDCWRLSDGVLDPADFLYTSPKGLTILFR